MPQIARRTFLTGACAATAAAGGLAAWSNTAQVPTLRIQRAEYPIMDVPTRDLVSLLPDGPPPVLRVRQNQPFTMDVENGLPDFTAMHWHGIRVPNDMDGVPYLTQIPIGQNERFRYTWTSKDAGTYWYHPHCMTMDQMAMGLTGLLVVDEAEDPGFDSDLALNLRDFRLGSDGQFIELWTARGAARSGTFGTVMTANWQVEPVYSAPAGGLLRLRVGATDTARIYRLFVLGAEGAVMALDGHPVREPVAFPTNADAPLFLSPGQRVDFAIEMPREAGQDVVLMTEAPGDPRILARITAEDPDLGHRLADLAPLPANDVPEPNMDTLATHEFVFGWSPDDLQPNNGVCGTLGYTFWSINRTPWPGDAASPVGPLAELQLGRSYRLRLRNESPNAHPIHLHGLVFRPIASNKRRLPSNWTDTVLLLDGETLDVVLVADNPGDWAFHCHVIEHQKTGLAGYLRVS